MNRTQQSSHCRNYIAYSYLFDELPDCGIDVDELTKVTQRLDFMTLTGSRENLDDLSGLNWKEKANEEETAPLLSKPSPKPLLQTPKQRKRSSFRDEAVEESVDPYKTPGSGCGPKKRKAWFGPIQIFE